MECIKCRAEIDEELSSIKCKIEISEQKFFRHIDSSEAVMLGQLDGLTSKLNTFIEHNTREVNQINQQIDEIKKQISERNQTLKKNNGNGKDIQS
jgi:hypothetical protein